MLRVVFGGDVEGIFKFIDGRDVLPHDLLQYKLRILKVRRPTSPDLSILNTPSISSSINRQLARAFVNVLLMIVER
jgi:hypothetical protein